MAATRRKRILIGTQLNLCPQERAEVPHAGESFQLSNGVHQLPGTRLAKDWLQQFQGFFLYFVSGERILRPALKGGHPLFQPATVSRDYLDDGLAFRSCAAQLWVSNERDLLPQIEDPGVFHALKGMGRLEGKLAVQQSHGERVLQVDIGHLPVIYGASAAFGKAGGDALYMVGSELMLRHEAKQPFDSRLDGEPDAVFFDVGQHDLVAAAQLRRQLLRPRGVGKSGQEIAVPNKDIVNAGVTVL